MDQNNLSKEGTLTGSTVVNTFATGQNIIDLVTADDVLQAYGALPVISKQHYKNQRGDTLNRTVIQQIQTLTINVGSAIAGAAQTKVMLAVVWDADIFTHRK